MTTAQIRENGKDRDGEVGTLIFGIVSALE